MSTLTLSAKNRLCECGCGQPTTLAKRTRRYLGHVQGEPLRFLPGHNTGPTTAEGRAVQLAKRGEGSPTWKGGRTQTSRGYIRVKLDPDHPFAAMCGTSGYVYEHRLVMALHLRRILDPREVVHHINEDVTDNRIENLMLFSNIRDHSTHHQELLRARRAEKPPPWKRCPHHHRSLDARQQCERRLNGVV